MLDVLGIAAAVEIGLGKDRLDVLGNNAVEDRRFREAAIRLRTKLKSETSERPSALQRPGTRIVASTYQ